jgi:dolichol-phosphate mannosyltransferase
LSKPKYQQFKVLFQNIFQSKILKFLIGGGLAAAVNLLLIVSFIELLNFNTPILRNVANVLAIELSLLASFFIYRIWVWPGGSWTLRDVCLKQIPLYHVSAGAAVLVRIFLVFPLLDWLGINYTINTLVGVLLSASINYLISDRWVFKNRDQSSRTQHSSDVYYPEGLAPALSNQYLNNSQETRAPSKRYQGKTEQLSVVIPAHNEEGCIVSTLDVISQRLDEEGIPYEILVVNDNSRDRTEALLQQVSSQASKIRYINNYYPNGFGFAVRCGLENFQGDMVAIAMADNSDSPDNLVEYYYKLQEGYDCVFGSRFIKGGRVIDYPKHKLIVNRLANLFIQVLFGLKLNDTTNAFKIYRRNVIEGIAPLISPHFNLTVEIPLKAIVRGYSYAMIPITWRNRAVGVSKLKLKEMGSRYLFIVLYLWLEKHLSRGDYRRRQPQKTVAQR